MMSLRRAVSSTISYASFFRFSLLPSEIHHWLICSRPVPLKKLQPYLTYKPSATTLRRRSQTARFSHQKILYTHRLLVFLKHLPGLRLLAISGSVAAFNAQKDDDIDLFFITAPNTLWLVRPLVIALITIFFHRRRPRESHAQSPNAFCPNFWLDTLSLSIPPDRRSLYTAHEVLQVIPLLDKEDTYRRFLLANSWTKKYLANAYQSSLRANSQSLTVPEKHYLFLVPLNFIFFLLQFLYMFPKKTSEAVHLHAAFLYTTDYSTQLKRHLKKTNSI